MDSGVQFDFVIDYLYMDVYFCKIRIVIEKVVYVSYVLFFFIYLFFLLFLLLFLFWFFL